MIQYADYNYYSHEYGGSMTNIEFRRNSIKASAFIRALVNGKLETDEFDIKDYEEVKYAVCEMADAIRDIEMTRKKTNSDGNLVKSVSNDGYSVSYVSDADYNESVEEAVRTKMNEIARQYLAETGLLSRCVYQ